MYVMVLCISSPKTVKFRWFWGWWWCVRFVALSMFTSGSLQSYNWSWLVPVSNAIML